MSLRRRDERGVSTLEALAALALIAIALIPLLDLQTNLARAAAAQEAAMRRQEARRNALVVINGVNPSVTPSGSTTLADGASMQWTARMISAETRGRAYPSGDGPFLVALYSVTVSLEDPRLKTSFEVERLGWRPFLAPAMEEQQPPRARR